MPSELEICSTIARSGLFDATYYLRQNRDVAKNGIDPILHYVRHGEKEFRNPSPSFNVVEERKRYKYKQHILYQRIVGPIPVSREFIPIVFACNELYIPALSVAIASIKAHAGNYYYDLYIFTREPDSQLWEQLLQLADANFNITVRDIASYLPGVVDQAYLLEHFTADIYYRIFMPEIVDYDKILYLDCDLVANEDIANLYNEDLDGYILGAIRNNKADTDYHRRLLGNLPEHMRDKYYNSGVLLINCTEFIEYGVKQACMDMISSGKKYLCPDQDMLNIACHDHIKDIPYKWNFQWHFFTYENYKYFDKRELAVYAENFAKPAIIHFSSPKKPWNTNDGHFAKTFWKYAQLSPFYEFLKAKCPYEVKA